VKKQIKKAQKYLKWKKPDQAIAELRPLLKQEAEQEYDWVAPHMLGIAFSLKNDYKCAAEYFEVALKRGSEEPETFHMLSVSYYNLGQFEEAVFFGKEAVNRQDDFLKAWINLGSVYRSQAKLEEALRCYQKANQLDPQNAGVAFRIGEIYRNLGDFDKALKLFEITLKIEPDYVQAALEKTKIYKMVGRHKEALEYLDQIINEQGEETAAEFERAEIFRDEGDYDRALKIYEELLEKEPSNGSLRVNYALCLQEINRFDESEASYRQAIDDMPDRHEPVSNYLMGLHYNPHNSKEHIFKEHIRLAERFLPKETVGVTIVENTAKDKKLRVGFVSGGFRRHPVGFMIAGALEQLPGDIFEIYCYNSNNKHDFVTRRIHKDIDVWRSIAGYNDKVVAEMIRKDQIDILVDLSGHAQNSRLQMMAMKPAPILVKWVGGLFNTTGLEAFDYLITDWYESPEGEEQYYTEKLVRLPDDYIVYTPPAYAPEVGPLPAGQTGHVTFGCFNNPTKVNEEVLKRWAKIMRGVPESRLFLKSKQYDTASFRNQILSLMQEHGIDPDRIEFRGLSNHYDHLGDFNKIDIALDPWPYSGGLTTCEALYMGVPVITLPGPTFAGRHSTTHLINAGLAEFVADGWEEYTRKTIELASNFERLNALRQSLRGQLRNSVVCNGKRFGAHLAVAFRSMWEQYVEGLENKIEEWQDHIDVKPLLDEEINELTEGPRVTPLLSLKGKEQPISQKEKDESENASSWQENILRVEIEGGITVCTPRDLDMLTPYVLLEQYKWFDPEWKFVCSFLQPGMKVLDVGASFGAYALPMAKKVGKLGAVYAFEPGSFARKHLERSKIENDFGQLHIMDNALGDDILTAKMKVAETPELNKICEEGSEDISVTTLDAWWHFAGKPEIDMLKLDVNGMEPEVLEGGEQFLKDSVPIVVVSIGEDDKILTTVREELSNLGYKLFEYIPGPGILAEHEPDAGKDPYLLNVIAVKEDLIQECKGSGWIFDETIEFTDPEGDLWKEVMDGLPWTDRHFENWQETDLSTQQEYIGALNLLCTPSKIIFGEMSDSRSQKAAMMLEAAQKLIGLFNNGKGGVAAAILYSRVMFQLGKRSQAAEMMEELMQKLNAGEDLTPRLPFLPPLAEQDMTIVQTDFSKWLTVRVVEAWVVMNNYTTYKSSKQVRQMLKALEGNPEALIRFASKMNANIGLLSNKNISQNHSDLKKRTVNRWYQTLFNLLSSVRPLNQKQHSLPSELIVSLTSYPNRFSTLHLTLACLFNQTIVPDRVILWIAYEDKKFLTKEIVSFQKLGLEIKFCDDLGPYKKIIPTLRTNPDSFIVTADDDVYYWQTWLEELVETWDQHKNCVIAHRAHRIRRDRHQNLLPYADWNLNFSDNLEPSDLNFPTGIGGVLYPPDVFCSEVTDEDQFMKLCPHGDDIWLYWMYRMNGFKVKMTGENRIFINWPESQKEALWKENLNNGRNDKQIQNMVNKYSFPQEGISTNNIR